jgi:dTDP-4-amino-4,6-dideoxygalactose transaminase
VASELAEQILCLPIYSNLELEIAERIAELIANPSLLG